MWLERTFPGTVNLPEHNLNPSFTEKSAKEPPSMMTESKTKKRNIIAKFLADQAIGGTVNTLAFIAFFAFIDGRDISSAIQKEFWPMRVASLKLWPAVSGVRGYR